MKKIDQKWKEVEGVLDDLTAIDNRKRCQLMYTEPDNLALQKKLVRNKSLAMFLHPFLCSPHHRLKMIVGRQIP